MKKTLVLFFAFSSINAFANTAKIVARNSDNENSFVSLDESKTPRTNGERDTYPTIKDYRTGADYEFFCYKGTKSETRELLLALVESANGDGDSFAELKSLKASKKGVFTVVTKITDEAGKKRETFKFYPCKK